VPVENLRVSMTDAWRGSDSTAEGLPVRGRILLVVDDPGAETLLTVLLRSRGFTVETATELLQAVAAFDDREFEIVLIDVMLRRGNGFQVAHEMRQRKRTNDAASISARFVGMLSPSAVNGTSWDANEGAFEQVFPGRGDSSERADLAVLRSEFDAFLYKPFDVTQLFDVLEQNLPTTENTTCCSALS
jgi:CheY-like chemotaxis protein